MKVTSIYRKDKIGTLTHGSGNINMASSILTIGGLQYDTEGARSVALPVMTANTRYQIYAVVSGGDVILVVSQNENSAGPSGYSSWKLVASIYSNASSVFGCFINLTGSPSTPFISQAGVVTNLTTNTTFNVQSRREGSIMHLGLKWNFTGLPNAVSVVTATLPFSINNLVLANQVVGIGRIEDAGIARNNFQAIVQTVTQLNFRFLLANATYVSDTDTIPFSIGNGDQMDIAVSFPVSGLDDTAIEDL